jgi:hypothetical protein
MPSHIRETHRRFLVKAVSWRLTGMIDRFVVSFFVTGRGSIADSIGLIELLTWELISWRQGSQFRAVESTPTRSMIGLIAYGTGDARDFELEAVKLMLERA